MKIGFSALGIMAGSSMDGLDIVHVELCQKDDRWTYTIGEGETIQYDPSIYYKLKKSASKVKSEQELLDLEFGDWIGEKAIKFIQKHNLNLDFISVHGHTVIHEPENNISWQLGAGNEIAKKNGITTITDFRSKDISLGGQGAPLVPIGDFKLFNEYDACLNLGGIANISLKESQTAWDITPCNQVLNYYANQLGRPFDENGELARQGKVDQEFLNQIQRNDFFKSPPPKSLPNQFLGDELLNQILPQNGLRSMTEFIAMQIASDLSKVIIRNSKMLITGGGAHNDFLIERIKYYLPNWQTSIPTKDLIDFKEAIVFAFLGALRLSDEINVLSSVTGATKDSSSGVIHFAK